MTVHDGMLIKLFFLESCVFAQEHDFPHIFHKKERCCVFFELPNIIVSVGFV